MTPLIYARKSSTSVTVSAMLPPDLTGGLSTRFLSGRFPVDAYTVQISAFFCIQTISAPKLSRSADRTRNSCAFYAAIPVGILRQILLVVILRIIKLPRLPDLRRNLPPSCRTQALLILPLRLLRHAPLLRVVDIDDRPVLRAQIIPLPHALRRIM